MVLRFFLLAATFLFSCTEVQRDNPYDSGGINFKGNKPSSSSNTTPNDPNTFTDPRDDKVYKIVKIGEQVWMAENLNYAAGDRKCCGSPSSELACPYGILYGSAGDNCPKGWHLPSETDWNKLMGEAGGAKIAGGYFKATSDWNQNSAGQDVFGFAAMPGGYWTPAYGCQKVGYEGYWWSTSGCIFRMSSSDNEVQRITDYRADQYGRDYFSVRCVKD